MSKLSDTERAKIKRALLLFETEDKIPQHYIHYIRDGLYEFRVSHGNKEFRLFFIYDGEQIVVLFNCFTKKTQKAPRREIEKAIKLKEDYKNDKKREKRNRNAYRDAQPRLIRLAAVFCIAVLILVLLVRPAGLLGKYVPEKV